MRSATFGCLLSLAALGACGTSDDRAESSASAETATFHPTRFADVWSALGGTVPFPPPKLVAGLLALEPDSNVAATIFPHGRSLERSVTDFRAPRSLLLWENKASVAPYRLYIAYTPNAEELEVLAWNWQRRQYDFLLVRDYAEGKTPRIEQPHRELCTACHQDGGPIFAVAPWNESTLNSAIQREVAAQAHDALSPYLLAVPSSETRIRVNPAVIDFQVRESTRMLQSQAVCTSACGGDLECRKGILLAALLENVQPLSSEHIAPGWKRKMTSAMTAVWPSDRFMIVSDSLADRRVSLSAPLRFEANEDPLAWRKAGSPKRPADATGDLMLAGYGLCWSFTREQIEAVRAWGADRIDAAMATEQMTRLAATWLPSEAAIVSALESAIASPAPSISPAAIAWSAPVDPVPPSKATPGASTTALYNDYCGYCHAGPAERPPILPLDDLAALGRYQGSAGRTVRGLLDPTHPSMPPPGAAQPSAEERQQMLSDLP